MKEQPTDPIWKDADRPVLADDWNRDGNAYALLGAARRAQRNAGWSQEQIDAWQAEAQSDNYDHLVQTILAWHDEAEGTDD